MANYLLDSNILTCLIRKRDETDFHVKQKFQEILLANARILTCPIVFYEVARDLYRKNAYKQLETLGKLVENSIWCEFNFKIWDISAQLWSDCRQKGTPTGHGLDKDVLIAAQVKYEDAVIVTNNTRHFKYLNIPFENWLEDLK